LDLRRKIAYAQVEGIGAGVAMKRREFITLVSGAAAAWPRVACAQQPAKPVIGYLRSDSPETSPKPRAEFLKGLAEIGYIDGRVAGERNCGGER
jgi:hypothetical protein